MSRLHHPDYAPSSMNRRLLCEDSKDAEHGLVDISFCNADADEGTMLHNAVASMILDGTLAKGLSQEQQELVVKCNSFFLQHAKDNHNILVEAGIKVCGKDGRELTFGTIDAGIIDQNNKYGIVIDFKFGRNEVESPVNNLQFACYALGLAQEFSIASVTAILFQPRLNSCKSYTFTEFDKIAEFIESVISKCESPDAKRTPGQKQCEYCKAKTVCKEAIEHFGNLPAVITTPVTSIVDPNLLSDLYLNWRSGAKKMIEAIENACMEYANKNNGKCGNLVLSEGRTTREVSDINEAFQKLSTKLTMSEFVSCLKGVSLPELEDALAKKYGAKKKEAKELLEEMLGELLVTKKGNKTLKKEKEQ